MERVALGAQVVVPPGKRSGDRLRGRTPRVIERKHGEHIAFLVETGVEVGLFEKRVSGDNEPTYVGVDLSPDERARRERRWYEIIAMSGRAN